MKKMIAALALLTAILVSGARAEVTLYAARETITREQAQAAAAAMEEALGERVELLLEEETGESVSRLVFAGRAPNLAVLEAGQAALWARAGLLAPLDGCVPEIARLAQPLADACVFEERLMLAPLLARRRVMAVRPERFQAVNMGYLLDSRAHPVWYPSEFVQAMDEMAVLDCPGMDVWPPQEGGSLWLEALLQGVGGLSFVDPVSGGYAADAQGLEDALMWLEDMLRAGLFTAQQDREAALERFIAGETAVFPDWSEADSALFADEIRREEILLRPYPALGGGQAHAGELVALCAFASGNEQTDALARRAVVALYEAKPEGDVFILRGVYDDGIAYLPLLGAQEYGATLRALLCEAVSGVIEEGESAAMAARRIDRAMRTMGWQ